jgi:hypothetical protein
MGLIRSRDNINNVIAAVSHDVSHLRGPYMPLLLLKNTVTLQEGA